MRDKTVHVRLMASASEDDVGSWVREERSKEREAMLKRSRLSAEEE
jgi:hypothetical protein